MIEGLILTCKTFSLKRSRC